MNGLAWKLRVAVLWIFLAVAETAGLVLLVYQPGTVRGITRGEVSGVDPGTAQAQINTALSVLVPLAMAFVTLVLSDQASRWANGVLGLLWAVTLFFLLLQGNLGNPLVFLLAVMFLVTLLILWHVWKWPKREPRASVSHEDRAAERQSIPRMRHHTH